MRAQDFITESTPLYIKQDDGFIGGNSIAVKSSLGRHNGSVITMQITKDEWEAVKHMPANTETMEYDIATAETIVRDWTSRGAKLKWKSPADFNQDARDLENHRFSNDPAVKDQLSHAAGEARSKAKAAAKSGMRVVDEAGRTYKGADIEKGATSISGNASPGIVMLVDKGLIKPGMKVLDMGAGAYARNTKYLQSLGVKCFAYDPYNGTGTDGWKGISTQLPSESFDVVFTCFVLNVVPEETENGILATCKNLAKQQFHVTRNMDIFNTVNGALRAKRNPVSAFFLEHFADEEMKQMFNDGTLTKEIILEFCDFGVQTGKDKFQRIPHLENKGYSLLRNTTNYKVYKN